MVSRKFYVVSLLLFSCLLLQAQTKKDTKKDSPKPTGSESGIISDSELNSLLLHKFSGDVYQYTSMEAALAAPDKVVELSLRNKDLTALPAGFSKFVNLKKLDLSGNKLSSLGNELADLSNLEILDLSNNSFSSIPSGVCSIRNLKTLYITGNQVTSIGSDISCLKSLEKLFAANNGLATLSPEIGKLAELKFLYLHNNKLTTLPEQIGDLNKLQVLTVQNNALSRFPHFIDKLDLLYYFEFEPQNSIELEKEKLRMDLIDQAYSKTGFQNRRIEMQDRGQSDKKKSSVSSLLGGRKQQDQDPSGAGSGFVTEANQTDKNTSKKSKFSKPSSWAGNSFGGIYFGRLFSFDGGSGGVFGVEYLKMFSHNLGFSTGLSRSNIPNYYWALSDGYFADRFLAVPALLHLGVGNTFRLNTELGLQFTRNLDARSSTEYSNFDLVPHTGVRMNLLLGKRVNLYSSSHFTFYPFSEFVAYNVVSGLSVSF